MEMTSFLSFSFHSLPLLPIQIKCKSVFGVFAKTIILYPHQKKKKERKKKKQNLNPTPPKEGARGLTKKKIKNMN